MKKENPGTNYVPTFHSSGMTSTLQERCSRKFQEERSTKSVSDSYYVSAIAWFCLTFVFPPAVIGAAICVYRAKKCQKGENIYE